MIAQIPLEPETPEAISLFDLLVKGGPVMIPIAFLSIATIYILVERWLYLRYATRKNAGTADQLRKFLADGDTRSAGILMQQDRSASGKVMATAMEYVGRPFREIESLIESSAEIELGRMERNLGYLGIIAGVAPMLGFIGTISGIIHIFYSISLSDNISIGIIAGGLYEKMITSGAGLVVGVTAYISYHILHQWIQRYSLTLQEESMKFLKIITTTAR